MGKSNPPWEVWMARIRLLHHSAPRVDNYSLWTSSPSVSLHIWLDQCLSADPLSGSRGVFSWCAHRWQTVPHMIPRRTIGCCRKLAQGTLTLSSMSVICCISITSLQICTLAQVKQSSSPLWPRSPCTRLLSVLGTQSCQRMLPGHSLSVLGLQTLWGCLVWVITWTQAHLKKKMRSAHRLANETVKDASYISATTWSTIW